MAPPPGIDAQHIKDTALKDLLDLLEGVRLLTITCYCFLLLTIFQVRGKKVLFLDRTLSGPIGLFAKFSVLKVRNLARQTTIILF